MVHSLALFSPQGSLEGYLRYVMKLPMLSAEEEYGLAKRLQQNGDLEAARSLILSHLRYVVRLAKQYKGYGLPVADLIQEGNIGLMKAVKRFDPDQGVRLVSFAVHWIKSEIYEYVVRNWRLVKIATTKAQRKLFFNLRKWMQNGRHLTHGDRAQIAEKLTVSEAEVLEMEKRLLSQDCALEKTEDTTDTAALAPIQYLSDPRHVAEAAVLADEKARATLALQEALSQLSPRAQVIVERRWLSDEKATLQALAEELGVSIERVRQLEKQALLALRSHLSTTLPALPALEETDETTVA